VKAPTKTKKAVKEPKTAKPAKEAKELELDLEEQEPVVEVAVKKVVNKTEHIEKDDEDRVGSMLKAARLKKGLEVSDIARQLCIRRVYLEAIESSDYAEIPDYPYGPGFVRSYADFLGLNGARLVQVFKDETDIKKKSAKDYYVPEPQVEVVAPNRKYLVISLISIAIVYCGWLLYSHNANTAKDTNPIDIVEEQPTIEVKDFPLDVKEFTDADGETLPVVDVSNTVQETPQVTLSEESFIEDEPEQPAPAATEEPVSPSKGVFLKVKQETWVAVQDDEKLYLSKVLKEGDTYKVPYGGKNMKLSVGRHGAVDVYIDGKLTEVVQPNKKTNIDLNQFISQ
jgi:cytoskeletal protein RodZ